MILAPGLVVGRDLRTMRSLKCVQRAPQVVHLDRQDDVGLTDDAAAEALIERMARREVHAPDIVDHAALQRLGKLDEVRHARPACAPGDRR